MFSYADLHIGIELAPKNIAAGGIRYFLRHFGRARRSEMPQTESFSQSDHQILPLKPAEDAPVVLHPAMRAESVRQRKKSGKFSGVLDYFFGKEKGGSGESLQEYLDLSERYPENATYQMKLGEIYQKKGEAEKTIAKYLQAAEIFSRENFFPQAIAIYKQVLAMNPHLVQANQKIGEIYQKMGFLADAIAQYRIVVKHNETWGRKEKIPQIMNLIQELENEKSAREKKAPVAVEARKTHEPKADPPPPALPRSGPPPKARRAVPPQEGEKENFYDLRAELTTGDPGDLKDIKEISTDKLFGFEEIFKELQETVIPAEVYPNFNYHMGKACREMGFNDGAIEQLQIAMQKGQNPIEAAKMLSRCFRDKGWFHEAQKYFEKAMEMENESRKKQTPSFKSEIVMLPS
jgi:tetratricopeptide (TPR) repeat protein